jgi:hypothetical protein
MRTPQGIGSGISNTLAEHFPSPSVHSAWRAESAGRLNLAMNWILR